MKMALKYIAISMLCSFGLAVFLCGILFLAFPPKDWSELLTMDVLDMPLPGLLISVPASLGGIAGILLALHTKKRRNAVEKGLDELIREQNYSGTLAELPDMQQADKQFRDLADLFRIQSEQAQRLATKRSEEREKSLQEVVIQERNRLARELHDSVSQQLFAASMMMSAFNETRGEMEAAAEKQLEMIEQMIQQSQLEMRALLMHLRPVPLKGKSLQEGAQTLLSELQQKLPLEISWKIETFPIEKGIEDQLFRILQESVSNTLRHANAAHLEVLIVKRDGMIIMRVTDDGSGFDISKVKTGSYGLSNMHERAFEAGGTCKIVSLPGEGTRLDVKIPLIQKGERSSQIEKPAIEESRWNDD